MGDNDKIRLVGNKIRMVDPNHFTNDGNVGIFDARSLNTPVHQEDLCIAVELTTQSKGRTVLIAENNNGNILTDKKDNLTINFIEGTNDKTTGGKNSLTTKYTEVSTRLDAIDETLGITSIDIEFNSSYAPMININFVDVRGASIFQSNGDSPYNVFFRLPYPLFQLTVKGYYGKPVTYCLHMLKCNTRFNSQTGNFEISAKFVGYTYALLSDMIIGYIKAAGGTKRGQELLKEKNCPSINSFLKQIKDIDRLIKAQLSSDNQTAINLSVVKTLEENLNSQEILTRSTINYLNTNGKYPVYESANSSIVIVKDPNPSNTEEFSDYDNYRVTVKNYEEQYNQKVIEYNKSLSDLTGLKIVSNLYVHQLIVSIGDLFAGNNVIKDKIKTYYGVTESPKIEAILVRLQDAAKKIQKDIKTAYIKFYDFTDISDSINITRKAIEEEDKNISNQIAIDLKNKLTSVLGFEPNIRNIVRIFTTHIEVFLQQIFEVSAKYNDQARVDELIKFVKNLDVKDTQDKKNLIIYPWPEYNKDNVEAYIGGKGVLTNPDNVPEIKFVEELFDRMLTDEELLNDLLNKVDNGQQAWASVSPVDSFIYNDKTPYDRLDNNATPDDIARLIGLRAMAFLGFSNTYLSPSEITAFANAEANLIIEKYKENKVLIQGLKEKFSTPDSYGTIIGKINGVQNKLLIDNGQSWKYNYVTLTSNGDSVSLLPIDSGYNNAIYDFGNKSTAKYTISSLYCDIDKTTIKTSYVSIIEREKYDETQSTSVIPQSNSSFNLNSLKTENINSYTLLNQAGFGVGQGKYGVQEYTTISYGGTEYGVEGSLPFFSIFYDNYSGKLTIPPAICENRTEKLVKYLDLTNEKGEPIPFSPLPFDPSNELYVNSTNGAEKNHNGRGMNLNLFNFMVNQEQISYPFFDFASVGMVSGEVFGETSISTNLFGSIFYNAQSLRGRAFLFLHNFPWRGLMNKTENIGIFGQPEILNIFRYRTGFVQVPKLLPAFIGGLLWRYNEGKNGNDPIIFKENDEFLLPLYNPDIVTRNLIGNNVPSYDEYMKYYLDNINIRYDDSAFPMSFCSGAGAKYAKLETVLINLPKDVKDFFINQFFEFSDNEFNTTIRPIFEITSKVNGNGIVDAWKNAWTNINNSTELINDIEVNNLESLTNNLEISNSKFTDRYKIFNYNSTKFGGKPDKNFNYTIEYVHNSDAENKLKELFFDYKYISNQSWRIWNESAKKEINGDKCSAIVTVDKLNSFNPYINTINDRLNLYISEGEKKKFQNNELEQVKFEIYRNLKKIYDKWVAFTDKPDKILFQCCTTNGVTPSRLAKDKDMNKHISDVNNIRNTNTNLDLIDSFRFITRSFKDIGDDFQINPLMIYQLLLETTNISFYDFIGRILTQNNFDFIALPTYIDYNNENELLSVFKPYSYTDAKNLNTASGPSFVCVYVGQTSTKLDFNGKSPYPNDGFNLTDDVSGLPKDMTLTGNTWEDIGAAFVVKYGQQNQSVFKDISLDQSEFGETAESLQITDSIANTYSNSNQTYVGQNLYNVFSVRSYKTEIEMLGDAMIQPMMYFQLDNIPMFRGAYLITKVKHNIVPNHMTTTFTGTRIRANETPLIDVATLYSSILNGYELPTAKIGTTLTRVNSSSYVIDYHTILVNNLPSVKTIEANILNGANVTNTSNTELRRFDFGRINESEMEPTISFYFSSTKIGKYDTRLPWSSAFISYIMKSADSTFPASALHKEYVTAAMNGTAGYEVFPLKAGLKIKAQVGDILTKPREGGYDVSHSDIIFKIENNTAYIVGGNLSNSVKQSTIKLDNGYITDATDTSTYQLLTKKTNNKYYGGKTLSTQPVNLVVSTATVAANPSIRVNHPENQDDISIYKEILAGIGAPPTDENLKYFYAWRQAEGAKALWNPFNTTWASGFVTTKYNTVGVRNYASRQDGIDATVKTLNQNYYKKIKAGLVDSIGAEKISKYIDELSLWGTGNGVNRVLSQNKLNPPPIARS